MSTERLTLNDEVAALKWERVLEAATDLFYERGYTNTTLDDVAARLGVTKPFIYKNFGAKPKLLATICARGVQSALDEIDAALARDDAPADTLRFFLPRYAATIIARQKCIAINIREEKNLLPEDAAHLANLRQTFMARIEGVLDACKKTGAIDVPDARIAAFALVGAVSWMTFWFNPDGPLSAEAVTEHMSAAVLNLINPGATL